MIQPSVIHLIAPLIGAFAVVILALAVFLPQSAPGHSRSETRTDAEARPSSLAARVPITEIRNGLIHQEHPPPRNRASIPICHRSRDNSVS